MNRSPIGDYKQAIHVAGCRYLQLDDCSFAYLCDPAQRAMLPQRGGRRLRQAGRDLYWYYQCRAGGTPARPCELLCMVGRAVHFPSRSSLPRAGYEPIADLVFNKVNVDGYFLEWDSDRAGGFGKPLRFLPNRPARSALGLITSKTGRIEDKDFVKCRIEEVFEIRRAGRVLSPQCGFASTEEGTGARRRRVTGRSCVW